jgi:hypothetical protein
MLRRGLTVIIEQTQARKTKCVCSVHLRRRLEGNVGKANRDHRRAALTRALPSLCALIPFRSNIKTKSRRAGKSRSGMGTTHPQKRVWFPEWAIVLQLSVGVSPVISQGQNRRPACIATLSIAGRDACLRGRSFTPLYVASFVAAKARATVYGQRPAQPAGHMKADRG